MIHFVYHFYIINSAYHWQRIHLTFEYCFARLIDYHSSEHSIRVSASRETAIFKQLRRSSKQIAYLANSKNTNATDSLNSLEVQRPVSEFKRL